MTDQINKKRAAAEENDEPPHFAGKRQRTPTNSPENQENLLQREEEVMLSSWLCIDNDDDSAESDLSKLLAATAAPPPPPKVTFSGNPYSSSLVFNSSSAYVTINGNDESCGSSFSESESSVMASVDLGGIWRRPTWDQLLFPAEDGGAWGSFAGQEEVGFVGEGSGGSGGGGDWVGGYDYDDMLAKFLGEDFMESQ